MCVLATSRRESFVGAEDQKVMAKSVRIEQVFKASIVIWVLIL